MTRMKRLACGAALTMLVAGGGYQAVAQETTAALRGQVSGQNGAPAGNVTVSVVHQPSGTRTTAVTDGNGLFDVRGLRIGGPYTVTTSGGGVDPRTVDDLYLLVGDTTRLDIAPEDLGTVASDAVEAVTVTGRRRSTETGPKTVLGRDSIEAVATINRDIRDLARRDMLVSQGIRGDGGISIAGSNPRTNRITIDGVTAQDPYGLETGGLPTSRGPISLDAVEQFSIAAVPTDVTNGNFTGGALNVILRSGGNDFHGAIFTNILQNNLVGTQSRNNTIARNIEQENYGAFLSGPIWRDRLFFALSYETFSTTDSTTFGPPGEGFANAYNNITRAQIDSIVSTYNTAYASDYAIGDVPLTQPITDEKYSAKIDLNITENHRASLTYRNAQSSGVVRADIGATTASLYSHWYNSTYDDKAITLEFNSNWTDSLSTNVKITSRDWMKGQDPVQGANYSDVSVCTQLGRDGTATAEIPAPPVADNNSLNTCATGFSSVRYGPDLNRHANRLNIQEDQIQATATYRIANHVIKAGYQGVDKTVFNIFLPNSLGTYYFDSIQDFREGRASRLTYRNAVSGNPEDAAANLAYKLHSFYVQDALDLTDTMRVTAGLRYDVFETDSVPTLNPNFQTRNGFPNTKTIDGLTVLSPRVSIEWRPTDRLKINAGGGLFSGGFPEVIFATPYYNTGFVETGIEIRRCATAAANCTGTLPDNLFTETANATGITPGFTSAIGAAALNNLQADPKFGFAIPQLVRDFQMGLLAPVGTPAVNPTSETAALAPDFEMPGEWKTYLTAEYDFGDGWSAGAQVVFTRAHNTITYVDTRATPLVANGVTLRTPDGRIRYDGLTASAAQRTTAGVTSTNPGGSRDLVAYNLDEGEGYIVGFRVDKRFDWGLDIGVSAAFQGLDELNPGLRFGTTGSSLYQNVPAGLDPNRDQIGTSIEEVGHRYKVDLSYRRNFFGDNETRFSLFGERQSGRAYGFTMQDAASGRSPVFGVVRNTQALYIPDIAGDANPNDLNVGLVTFATAADRDRFLAYVAQFNLPTTAGILPKYRNKNEDIARMDFQFSQQLPTPWTGHKLKVQVDVRNVLNLLNSKWGRVEEYFDGNTLVRVACATAAGVAAGPASTDCSRYLYSQVPTAITPSLNSQQSVWYAQIGLRYEF